MQTNDEQAQPGGRDVEVSDLIELLVRCEIEAKSARYQNAADDADGHIDQQDEVQRVFQACFIDGEQLLEELFRHTDDPAPVQRDMDCEHCTEHQAEQFVIAEANERLLHLNHKQ